MITPLPIDDSLDAIVAKIREQRTLLVVAEPGAGKTTRLPPALSRLWSPRGTHGANVIVSQPRRIAARLAAVRVAQELECEVGAEVGYQVRFENKTTADTRIRFVTEGVLLRQLIDSTRPLADIDAVVLDEFHERHVQTDACLALLVELRKKSRPDLAIVIMSATLEAESVAEHLECAVMDIPGRRHEVTIHHDERGEDKRLEKLVERSLRRARKENDGRGGDALVFLPGAAEIRRCIEACEGWASHFNIQLEALHGTLPLAAQVRALAPAPKDRSKVIFATNVAETSITVEGVTTVVDTGLAKQARHSPWSGLSTLETRPISRSSAVQRAGRAGRTQPGRCYRLYSKHAYARRPEHDQPEILRTDLAELMLLLNASPLGPMTELSFLDQPPQAAMEAAQRLLHRLGALEVGGALTAAGRRMAMVPLHPRLSRLVLEAEARGHAKRGALLAATLQERDIRSKARSPLRGTAQENDEVGPSDGLALVEAFEAVKAVGLDRRRIRAHGLEPHSVLAVSRATRSIENALSLQHDSRRADDHKDQKASDDALRFATLAAFPDRVAWRRRAHGDELVFAGGGSARLAPLSVVKEAKHLVAVDALEDARGRVVVHSACGIEPEWLLDLEAIDIEEERSVRLNAATDRVEAVETLRYGKLVLDETSTFDVDDEEALDVLFTAALEAGIHSFVDAEELELLRSRIEFVSQYIDELEPLTEADVEKGLYDLCRGRRSIRDLERGSLLETLLTSHCREHRASLERLAPKTITIPGRQRIPVAYERGKPPSISSRLQDFFGQERGPSIAGGRQPLVLHLLAPNFRAVQVTTDLAGFWERHYPAIRKQLRRRYPKHSWPEDPLKSAPPRGHGRRRR